VTGQDFRRHRIAAGIPGAAICVRARIARSRLSDVERGYVTPTPEEMSRLREALHQELVEAREKVDAVAAEVGCAM
jgi:transcriptional regulator with XRE-family HTH domain